MRSDMFKALVGRPLRGLRRAPCGRAGQGRELAPPFEVDIHAAPSPALTTLFNASGKRP